MLKLLALVGVLVVAAIFTGVLEVKTHPKKITAAPQMLIQLAANGNLYERGRALVVTGKRTFELYSAQQPDQKMEVLLGFVREDAARLDKLLSSQPQPQKILPQAQLLAKSVEQAREQSQKLSEGKLADLKNVSQEAFNQARGVLGKLAQLQQDVQTNSDQLTDVVKKVGEVAGVSDHPVTPTPQPSPSSSSVPLRF